MVRFRKRAPTTLTPLPPNLPLPSPHELRDRLQVIKNELADLHEAVDADALKSLSGDADARARISAAHTKAHSLAAEELTIQSGLRQLQAIEREDQPRIERERRWSEFHRNRDRWLGFLQGKTRERYEALAFHLVILQREGRHEQLALTWEGPSWNPGNRGDLPPGAANIPRQLAVEMVTPICRTRKWAGTNDPNVNRFTDEVDVQLRDEFVADLLASAELPECPADMKAFLAMYRQKK